jgi:hypothetical protein
MFCKVEVSRLDSWIVGFLEYQQPSTIKIQQSTINNLHSLKPKLTKMMIQVFDGDLKCKVSSYMVYYIHSPFEGG